MDLREKEQSFAYDKLHLTISLTRDWPWPAEHIEYEISILHHLATPVLRQPKHVFGPDTAGIEIVTQCYSSIIFHPDEGGTEISKQKPAGDAYCVKNAVNSNLGNLYSVSPGG
jgi:hypothetical protein